MILGGGPNRIGQGIEFDYCCVHAAIALREAGFETIMVNCNPETVSTDYDTSDRLYFESLTFEDVMEIIELEKPNGVIVQYGGQTPLKLARALEAAGAKIVGTYYFNTERSSVSQVLNKPEVVPGKWRSCEIPVNKGEHTYTIEIQDKRNTILTRYIVYK